MFVSTRHAPPPRENPLLATQIYLMDGDGTNVRRLTENNFPALSRGGTKIVFESNRLRTERDPEHFTPVPEGWRFQKRKTATRGRNYSKTEEPLRVVYGCRAGSVQLRGTAHDSGKRRARRRGQVLLGRKLPVLR